MNQIVAAGLPLVLMLLFFAAPIHALSWLRRRYRKNRRSPLTTKLLRGPGQALQQEIDELEEDLSAYLAVLLMFPFLLFSVHLSQSYFGAVEESTFRWVGDALALAVVVFVVSRKLYLLSRRKFSLQCGLEAEVAMGQELDQLMRHGAFVFHDVPAEHFNIDHIVLTKSGLFAVETKGRMKLDNGGGKHEATARYDGGQLSFPGWRDTKTAEQARRQAAWLSKWISKAVGEVLPVRPVVALPGWFVERTGRGDVIVISGREAPALLKAGCGHPFSEQLMMRIAHQLEQRCRDVEPTQYGRERRLGREARIAR